MNGPLSMYNLKPVIRVMDGADISSSMYAMKNIRGSYFNSKPGLVKYQEKQPNVLEQVKKLLKVPLAEVEHLEQHQESILKQLALLKEQMAAFRVELSQQAAVPLSSISRSKSASCSSTTKPVTWNGLIHDVVVNASPTCPPHSLLAVRRLWSEALNLQITCFTHSSVVSPPYHLAHFQSKNGSKQTGLSKLNVSLIWKDMGPDCEVVVSPLNQLALRGEVNLIRYLHHTLYPTPADIITETKLDNLLDICHRFIHARTIKEKQSLIRAINALLGKSTWLGGDTMDVADIAAWSAIQNTENVELTQNMKKWQERCKDAIGLC